MDRTVALQTCTDAGIAPPGRPASTECGPEPVGAVLASPAGSCSRGSNSFGSFRSWSGRASTAPGVQRTGEVAVSMAVAVWDEDPGYRGGEAGAAGTR
jgi:hypothetical protein